MIQNWRIVTCWNNVVLVLVKYRYKRLVRETKENNENVYRYAQSRRTACSVDRFCVNSETVSVCSEL